MWEKTKRGLDSFEPRLVTSNKDYQQRELMKSVLPKGCNLMPEGNMGRRTGASFGQSLPSGVSAMGGVSSQSNSTAMHMMRPYDPEVEDPSRQFYPQDRLTANRYWRLFHKYDPVFGTAIDLFCELVVSDFELIIEDDPTKSIKDSLEYMNQTVNIQDKLRHIIREYLVIGEVFPHLFFSESSNMWDYCAMHNPDYISVADIPIVNGDAIINFMPDMKLKTMLSDGSPESREFRRKLPNEFVAKVLAGQKIRLNPVNCSFIARKLHSYDDRGTSLASRMFRIWMVEDALYNSTLATYRRAANPLKVAKLGDQSSGWLPSPAVESKLADLLARAETDPQCFVPETLITKSDGTQVSIGDLIVGDHLLDKDGNSCTVEVLQEEFSTDLINLQVMGAPLIKCTPQHKWDIWGGPRKLCRQNRSPANLRRLVLFKTWNPYQRLESKDLVAGDYLMVPRKFEEVVPVGVSPEKARLLGYYAAEGYTRFRYGQKKQQHGFGLCFSLQEKDREVKDCVDIITALCGSSPTLRCREEVHSCEVHALNSNFDELAHWLEDNAGFGSHTKELSQEVMQWPLSLKYEFMKGYLAGDGSCTKINGDEKNRYVSVCSVSLNLINQVKLILAQLGTYASLQTKINPEGSFGVGKPYYRLDFYGDVAAKFSRDVWGFAADDKTCGSGGKWWRDDDYIYVLIRSVTPVKLDEPQKVINMTVSGDHSYLTNCIGTRNSWLIWNYGINFEAFGVAERSSTIGKEQNNINDVKFLALGIAKGVLSGDQTFAAVKSGLQVFLRRLLSLRQFLEAIWIYPKYFRPICEINEWVKAIPSEVTHRYRVKRTAQEIKDQKLLLLPKLQWKNRLDPSIDSEILNALNLLKGSFGYKVSKSTLDSFTGLDWQAETRKSVSEWKQEQETVDNLLGETLSKKYLEQNDPKAAAPPGAPGSGAKPPAAGGKPPGPGSGSGSFPPGVSKGEGEAAPGSSLNMTPENPASGGTKQTIE